jgi:hypothetical protein
MTQFTEEAGDMSSEANAIVHAVEPPSALVIGGILGGCAFLLCALLLGARVAICIAALGVLAALWRRIPGAAVAFALAAALAVSSSTAVLLVASAIFGIALALFARMRMRARVAEAIDGRMQRGPAAMG